MSPRRRVRRGNSWQVAQVVSSSHPALLAPPSGAEMVGEGPVRPRDDPSPVTSDFYFTSTILNWLEPRKSSSHWLSARPAMGWEGERMADPRRPLSAISREPAMRCCGSSTGSLSTTSAGRWCPTGTNLLGLVKHTAGTEAGYFGDVFDRPFPEHDLPWTEEDAETNADMWATADESRADIVDLYQPGVGALRRHDRGARPRRAGRVPWWPGEPAHLAPDSRPHDRRDEPSLRPRRHRA